MKYIFSFSICFMTTCILYVKMQHWQKALIPLKRLETNNSWTGYFLFCLLWNASMFSSANYASCSLDITFWHLTRIRIHSQVVVYRPISTRNRLGGTFFSSPWSLYTCRSLLTVKFMCLRYLFMNIRTRRADFSTFTLSTLSLLLYFLAFVLRTENTSVYDVCT